MQEEYNIKRKEYLDGKISHMDFYLWLADRIGIDYTYLLVELEVLKRSSDKHFNDIPLKWWDSEDAIVRSKASRAGMKQWSLSDTVCVLKTVARRLVDNS